MPSEQLQMIVQVLRSRATGGVGTVEETRQWIGEPARMFDPFTARLMAEHAIRLEPVEVAGVPGEWIIASAAEDAPVILYLHGGGYVAGSIQSHRDLVARIAHTAAARALIVDYRLAPEHPFPSGLEDCVAAYRVLLRQGTKPSQLVVAGDSAGGNLTVATLVAGRDAGEPLPAAAVCLSPSVDLARTGESLVTKAAVDPVLRPERSRYWGRLYLGDVDPRMPLASPLYADLHGLPPLLIQVGTAEILLDDAVRLAERARAAGVEVTLEKWEDMIHVWQIFAPILPEGQQAIERIGQFIRERTAQA